MNQIARTGTSPASLIVALKDDFARKAHQHAYRLRSISIDTWRRERESAGQEAIAAGFAEAIADGETTLADERYQALAVALKPMVAPATIAQIKHEVAYLLAAFPTKDDLTAFVAIAVDEIAEEHPSRLQLAIACRALRRTATFRPSIAEMLDALVEAHNRYAYEACEIAALPKYIEAAKRRLANPEDATQSPGLFVVKPRSRLRKEDSRDPIWREAKGGII